MKDKLPIIIMGLVLLLCICIIEPSNSKINNDEPKFSGESSIYALAGEFKIVFANLLWMKADNYQDEFSSKNKDWTKNKDNLQLYDLITLLDPTFEEAYACKAYIYADGDNNPKRALKEINVGIKYNPRSVSLYEVGAIINSRNLKNPKNALPYAQKALEYSQDEFSTKKNSRLLCSIKNQIANNKSY